METYVEYDICVNKKTYHVTVSEEHNDKETIIALTFTDGKEIHISIGKARCNPTDEFDLAVGVKTAVKDCTMLGFYGYRVGLDDAIWHGFRRAQWHKMHDVTDEQMMITHWMPLSDHSRSTTLSPETIAGIQKMVSSIENAFKINGDSEGRKPVGFMHVDTPAGLTVSDGKVSLHEMTYHRIDTEDDDWISVEELLTPETIAKLGGLTEQVNECIRKAAANGTLVSADDPLRPWHDALIELPHIEKSECWPASSIVEAVTLNGRFYPKTWVWVCNGRWHSVDADNPLYIDPIIKWRYLQNEAK